LKGPRTEAVALFGAVGSGVTVNLTRRDVKWWNHHELEAPLLGQGNWTRMVSAVLPDGSYPAFGEGVRLRGAHRGEDGLDAFRGDDAVEAGGQLFVAVADEELHSPPSSSGHAQ